MAEMIWIFMSRRHIYGAKICMSLRSYEFAFGKKQEAWSSLELVWQLLEFGVLRFENDE